MVDVLDQDSLRTTLDPYVEVDSCTIPELNPGTLQFCIPVTIKGRNRSTDTAAMVDSGATGKFVGRSFVAKHQILTHRLVKPIPIRNVDGTGNKAGNITDWCQLRLRAGTYDKNTDFLITDLGSEDMILGLPWLREVNPVIDWETGNLTIGATELDQKEGPCGKMGSYDWSRITDG